VHVSSRTCADVRVPSQAPDTGHAPKKKGKAKVAQNVGAQDVLNPLLDFGQLAPRFKFHDARPLQNLADAGVKEPLPVQQRAIPCIMAMRDVYAVAPTGSGKTLAFLLPGAARSNLPCRHPVCTIAAATNLLTWNPTLLNVR
jgi:superfamily II DNA/RNA helicase